MPAWFKYSKNARKDTPQNKKKQFCEPNDSTMNRICHAFEDIGNINMNYAGIPPFNWQMLLSKPCINSRPEIPELFFELDSSDISNKIKSQDSTYADEKKLIYNYIVAGEDIAQKMIDAFGPLEESYPYIVKHLFAGEGEKKSVHKQMFWRVYGHIALENIRNNLVDADSCPKCQGMRVPKWMNNHVCIKSTRGFDICIDCGRMFEKVNSKQHRCQDCQEVYKVEYRKKRQRAKREEQKALTQSRISRLQSFSTET